MTFSRRSAQSAVDTRGIDTGKERLPRGNDLFDTLDVFGGPAGEMRASVKLADDRKR